MVKETATSAFRRGVVHVVATPVPFKKRGRARGRKLQNVIGAADFQRMLTKAPAGKTRKPRSAGTGSAGTGSASTGSASNLFVRCEGTWDCHGGKRSVFMGTLLAEQDGVTYVLYDSSTSATVAADVESGHLSGLVTMTLHDGVAPVVVFLYRAEDPVVKRTKRVVRKPETVLRLKCLRASLHTSLAAAPRDDDEDKEDEDANMAFWRSYADKMRTVAAATNAQDAQQKKQLKKKKKK